MLAAAKTVSVVSAKADDADAHNKAKTPSNMKIRRKCFITYRPQYMILKRSFTNQIIFEAALLCNIIAK